MSRKKLKNRRRIDRAQRNILIAAVCIAAVIIGGGICGRVIKKNASETMATAGSETGKTTAKKKEAAKSNFLFLMQVAGLEPARCCHRQILSLLRLPFRHIRKPYYNITDADKNQ